MDKTWVPRSEALKILGVKAPQTLTEFCIRHKIEVRKEGGLAGNKTWYPKAKLLQLARELGAATDARRKYKNAAIDELPRIDQGKVAARAFKLFAENVPLPQVVILLEITGEEVAALFKNWWELNRITQEWQNPSPAPAPAARAAPTTPAPPPDPEPEVYVKKARSKGKPYEAPDRNAAASPEVASPNACTSPASDGMCCPTHFLERRRTNGAAH